jgi:hypothetical protein
MIPIFPSPGFFVNANPIAAFPYSPKVSSQIAEDSYILIFPIFFIAQRVTHRNIRTMQWNLCPYVL